MADTPGRKLADMLKNVNQGDIWYDNGTDIVQLTPGTQGYRLTTQGAAANPSWAPDITFIETVDTSSGTTLETVSDSEMAKYDAWLIEYVGVSCTATSNLRLRFNDTGVVVTASNYNDAGVSNASGTVSGVGNGGAANWTLNPALSAAGNTLYGMTTVWALKGQIWAMTDIGQMSGAVKNSQRHHNFDGTLPTTLDGFTFTWSSGDFDLGSIHVYGIGKISTS
jgi:hypothetical protein